MQRDTPPASPSSRRASMKRKNNIRKEKRDQELLVKTKTKNKKKDKKKDKKAKQEKQGEKQGEEQEEEMFKKI